ncbi:MAG: MFS family permease [Porticoccaceae bacterium]
MACERLDLNEDEGIKMVNGNSGHTPVSGSKTFGPLLLMPGVGRINAMSFFAVALINNIIFSLVHYMQPYIFEVQLNIPADQQGVLVGNLTVMQELIVIAMTGIAGALADRFGRRPVFVVGTLFIGVAYSLYPLAEGPSTLYLARAFFGVGIACASTVLLVFTGDYSEEKSRGKWLAGMNVMQGLGAVTASFALTKVPGFLQQHYDVDPVSAGAVVFLIAAVIAVVGAVVAAVGLKPATAQRNRPNKQPLSQLFAVGFREARANPRTALSFAASMAARGDMVVIGAFTFLWMVRYSSDMGMGIQGAYARGQLIVPLITLMIMLSAPVMGVIFDKIDRVSAIIIAFVMASIGYTFMGLIENPYSNATVFAAILVGLGEGACIMSSIALVGQNAPEKTRGSVIGTFAACGAIGMLIATGVGGYLFDHWTYTGPYLFMGIANALVVIFAIYVKVRCPVEKSLEAASTK